MEIKRLDCIEYALASFAQLITPLLRVDNVFAQDCGGLRHRDYSLDGLLLARSGATDGIPLLGAAQYDIGDVQQ